MPKYYLRTHLSPTYYNLAKHLQDYNWHATKFPFLSKFGEKNLDYNQEISTQLEYKNRLVELCQKYCPDIIPNTYLINDNNWREILNKIKSIPFSLEKIWILKPALLNNGQHICLFNNLEKIKAHFLSPYRMGGEHVLQEYISKPHLLKGPKNLGHKYSIRMFMVLTHDNNAFLYSHGYFNIAVEPYQENNIDDVNSHITNEHLQEDRVNVIQIPTFKYDFFKPLYPKIKLILSRLTTGLQKKYPVNILENNISKLAIFGMDFIVDAEQKVWLIEANHGPCFPTSKTHDLYESLYSDFWHSLIENFVLVSNQKPAQEKTIYPDFERL